MLITLFTTAALAVSPETVAPPSDPAVPVVVDLEWRANALDGHASHGPGFGVAVGLLDDHLRVGIGGMFRPGPLNPATFTWTGDQSYKGQDSLELRSDGGYTGATVAVGTPVGERFRVDVNVLVGFGGFGYYLVGEDRDTPDDRLPSVWEDELMDGRDSSLGLATEGGLRLTWTASEAVQPYVNVRYSWLPGYDAYMSDRYDGAGVAIGVSVGRF